MNRTDLLKNERELIKIYINDQTLTNRQKINILKLMLSNTDRMLKTKED